MSHFNNCHVRIWRQPKMQQVLHILRFQWRLIDIHSQKAKELSQCQDPMLVLGNCTFSVFYHEYFVLCFVFCLLLIFDFFCCIVMHTNCFTFISGAYDWVNSLPFVLITAFMPSAAANKQLVVVSIDGRISSLAFVFRIQTKNLSSWGRGGKE